MIKIRSGLTKTFEKLRSIIARGDFVWKIWYHNLQKSHLLALYFLVKSIIYSHIWNGEPPIPRMVFVSENSFATLWTIIKTKVHYYFSTNWCGSVTTEPCLRYKALIHQNKKKFGFVNLIYEIIPVNTRSLTVKEGPWWLNFALFWPVIFSQCWRLLVLFNMTYLWMIYNVTTRNKQ